MSEAPLMVPLESMLDARRSVRPEMNLSALARGVPTDVDLGPLTHRQRLRGARCCGLRSGDGPRGHRMSCIERHISALSARAARVDNSRRSDSQAVPGVELDRPAVAGLLRRVDSAGKRQVPAVGGDRYIPCPDRVCGAYGDVPASVAPGTAGGSTDVEGFSETSCR